MVVENPSVTQVGPPGCEHLLDISPKRGVLIEVPNMLRPSFQANPLRAARDLAAIPSFAIDPWDPDGYAREDQCNKERSHPGGEEPVLIDGKRWYFRNDWMCRPQDLSLRWIHVDLALSRDLCGMAMAHAEPFWMEFPLPDGQGTERRPRIVIDLLLGIKAPAGGQINFGFVRERIYEITQRGFAVAGVSFDGWNSVDSQQILTDRGYYVEQVSVDRDMKAYECLLDYMRLEGSLDFYHYPIFLQQWKRLQLVNGKKVDHLDGTDPESGMRYGKDVTDAAAAAVFKTSTVLLPGGWADIV